MPSRSMIDEALIERKIKLIFDLYINPADQDYLAARWAFDSGLFQNFYMSAAQALEKYLKAALLLQDQSTKMYGHDLVAAYKAISKFDLRRCMPEVIDMPVTNARGREAWQGKPTELFMDYMRQYGSPDNRYAFYGTFVNGPVLGVLDNICCALRTLMRRTNFANVDIFDFWSANASPIDRIADKKDWMLNPRALLERLYVGRYQVGQDERLRRVFLNMNMSFTLERSSEERTFGGEYLSGSPLYHSFVRTCEIDPSPENRIIVDQLRQWAVSRIQISKPIRRQLGFEEE